MSFMSCLSSHHFASFYRVRMTFSPTIAGALDIKNAGVIKDTVKCRKKVIFPSKVIAPGTGLFAAGKYNRLRSFLRIPPIDQMLISPSYRTAFAASF